MPTPPNVLFLGATNQLSLSTFESLQAGGVSISAVIVSSENVRGTETTSLERLYPAERTGQLPLINPFHKPTLIHAAWSSDIPVYALSDTSHPELFELLDELQPDAACVACFPRKLPADLIRRLPLGFLNVHPSILPHYRGPAPLFWLFRKDDQEKRGISVHLMDEGLDTGPLVCQERMRFSDGLRQVEIERQCGHVGGRLLRQGLASLSAGIEPAPQPEGGGYHPWPQTSDYDLNINWSARRAFNFMRATDQASATYRASFSGSKVSLVEALAYEEEGLQITPVIVEDSVARVKFDPGVLVARVSPLAITG